MQKALDALRRSRAAWFICYDPDRLARSLTLQLVVTDEIERAGARLEFVNFEYKNTAEGQLFYSMRGAIAQYEKAKIRERTMRGRRQKAKGGGLTHNPCIFGYDFDPVMDTLSVNEEKARTVRMVFRWFLEENVSCHVIAQRLTALGIAAPRGGAAWNNVTVKNMLANESYTGTLHLQKHDYTDTSLNKFRPKGEKVRPRLKEQDQWCPVTIPAIVDKVTYKAAAARLEHARRWWSGWYKDEYLISGLGQCALCGRPVHGYSRQSTPKSRIRYYVCRGYTAPRQGDTRCAFGRLRAASVEEQVWEEVRAWVMDPDRLRELLTPEYAGESAQAQLKLLRHQLADIESEHERTVRFAIRGSIRPELVEGIMQEQIGRIADLRSEIARLEGQTLDSAALEAQIEAVEDLRREVGPRIDQLSFTERRRLVRALVKTVILSKEETLIVARMVTINTLGQTGSTATHGQA